jgi:cobalt-zinc-cadmium efflux system outer membrane protein
MKTLYKTRSVALAVTVSIAVAALSVCALHAQAVAGQIQTSTSTTTSDAVQTAGAAYAAGLGSVPDPRKPPVSRPGALTLTQVMDLARSKSPMILATELKLRATQAQEIQAGLRANPYFDIYGYNLTRGQDNPNDATGYSVQFSRLFERGDKRKWRLEDAQATTLQTQAQIGDFIRQGKLSMKTAFTRMLIAKEALELATARLKDLNHEVDIAHNHYKAGDLGKLDYERLDMQLGDYESDEANDIINFRQDSDQLQMMAGIETPTAEFDIVGEIVPPNVTKTQEELVQSALANRPDYAEARFATAAAIAKARLEVANGTTDPTIEAEYDRGGTDNSVGLSVVIPLRIFNRNQGNKDTARLLADASHLNETVARYQVISDVDQAWVGYVQAKRVSDRFGSHYLDESQDVLSTAQSAYEHGGIALIDYLDALRGARSTSLNALYAYQQTWLAIYRLSAASSTELVP